MSLRRSDGQILVLFVLILTVLIGFAALVVDIGSKYASERRYQAITDGASLAGAQDLQPASRQQPVTPAMQEAARLHALTVVLDGLVGGAAATCDPTKDIDDCPLPGNQFRVSIRTPAPKCVDCIPDRSVQVTIREPEHSNSFARLYGQPTWNLFRTSVAGLTYGRSYTIVALRPPQPNGTSGTYDVRDLRLGGGTNVYVQKGDVGTNSNMAYDDNSGNTKMHIVTTALEGYGMYYFDPYNGPEWTPPTPADPVGKKISKMIKDPGYVIPTQPGTGGSVAAESVGSPCATAAAGLLASPTYGKYIPADKVTPTAPDMGNITCLLPGYFATDPLSGSLKSDVVILLKDATGHGLFYFGAGLSMQSSLIGGFVGNEAGVAVVIPKDKELNVNTNGSSRPTALMLNAGTRQTGGAEASPALDFNGNPIVTNTNPAIKMTLMVTRDTNCVVPGGLPTLCDDTKNDAIKIAGQSDIYLAGVQFMPSDQTSINSSAATGYIGQIWTWTIKYDGGVTLTQEGAGAEGPGHIRIDTACSPGEKLASGDPPEACR